MYDDVLLPTDGTDGVAAAAHHAGTLAETYGATVHVLSVVDARNRFESPSAGVAADVWEETERERAETAVAAAVEALPDDVAVEPVVTTGVPKTEIVEYAAEHDLDLVVMATHGRTGIDHYLIGSVAEKVVRTSPVPVMTVRLDGDGT